jgi:hypothetical protein
MIDTPYDGTFVTHVGPDFGGLLLDLVHRLPKNQNRSKKTYIPLSEFGPRFFI